MIISAIAAVSKNGVIGKNNDIPWYLSSDLRFFKRTTLNHHIIMGRKNFQSIGRPLPKRTNIIITRDPFFIVSGCLVVNSIEEALQIADENGEEEAFIIGGGQIYQQTISRWDKLYLTEVEVEINTEEPENKLIFFPEILPEEWDLIFEEHHLADEKNEYNYTFKTFVRKITT